MSAFVKLRDTVRAIGLWNTCLFAASRVLHSLFGARIRILKYYFIAQPIDAYAGARRGSGSFSLTWIDAPTPLFSQIDRPSSVIAARFAQRARCLAATVDGSRFAGFLWYTPGPYEEDEVRARFWPKPDGATVWDFDVSILPQYRMGRLFMYLWSRAATELAARGVTHSVSRVSAFNSPSLAAHQRLGARIVGKATFLCIGRWQLMRSTVSPRWHVSSRPERRPTLEIHAAPPRATPRPNLAPGDEIGHGAASTRDPA
ncbi:MAG TPA: GNAT family N-acetyltransferase [Casimicrobiaceae bacterium]|jgi:hypothetical protein